MYKIGHQVQCNKLNDYAYLTPRKIQPWNTALIIAYKNVLVLHENLLEGLKVMAQDDANTV